MRTLPLKFGTVPERVSKGSPGTGSDLYPIDTRINWAGMVSY